MITQLARPDGLALRAGRPRALGTGRTRDPKGECDERAYTYQQERCDKAIISDDAGAQYVEFLRGAQEVMLLRR
jgi:hypothetical protein